MTVTKRRTPVMRHAIAALFAASMLAGCATGGGGGIASASKSATQARKALAKGQVSKAITVAEAAVVKAPRSAALRTVLAEAYLKAGRFKSAVTTFDDAMELGDNSPRTALALALSLVGDDQPAEALAILEDWRADIPAADQGLALALAGEPGRGVALMSDALRRGENTPKLRQNLAYAYALDGRWRDARLMASQDVPADALDARITEWAQSATPEARRQRVATVLGVPLRDDPGQPAALALANSPDAVQLAAQAVAPTPEPVATAVEPASAPVVAVAVAAPEPAAVPVSESSSAAIAEFASVLPPVEAVPAPAQAVAVTEAAAAIPVSEPVPAPRAIALRTVSENPVPARVRPAKAKVTNGSHLIQLGSFASEQGARRAWGIFTTRNTMLKDYKMTIIPVVVNGRNYWRVAAAGFTPGDARSLCGTMKRKGAACFAYATPKSAVPVPGGRDAGAVMRAKRR